MVGIGIDAVSVVLRGAWPTFTGLGRGGAAFFAAFALAAFDAAVLGAAFFAAVLAAGFFAAVLGAAFLAAGFFAAALGAAFLVAVFFVAVLAAVVFLAAAAFLAGAFFTAFFAAGLAGVFLAADFFTGAFAAVCFVVVGFLAAAFWAGAFFVVVFFAFAFVAMTDLMLNGRGRPAVEFRMGVAAFQGVAPYRPCGVNENGPYLRAPLFQIMQNCSLGVVKEAEYIAITGVYSAFRKLQLNGVRRYSIQDSASILAQYFNRCYGRRACEGRDLLKSRRRASR